jgi:hypothetical protein
MNSGKSVEDRQTRPTHKRSSRRTFLVSATGAASAVCAGALITGCEAAANDRQLVFTSFGDALRELDRLKMKPEPLKPATAWTWAQTLNHCAQSIEYSMTGFPLSKPAIFQRTVGAAAVNVFSWRGRMTHDLGEPIPGAPSLQANTDSDAAMVRLLRAIDGFEKTALPLHPHFAYGELNKTKYEHAHAMHLANHFSAFDTAA